MSHHNITYITPQYDIRQHIITLCNPGRLETYHHSQKCLITFSRPYSLCPSIHLVTLPCTISWVRTLQSYITPFLFLFSSSSIASDVLREDFFSFFTSSFHFLPWLHKFFIVLPTYLACLPVFHTNVFYLSILFFLIFPHHYTILSLFSFLIFSCLILFRDHCWFR